MNGGPVTTGSNLLKEWLLVDPGGPERGIYAVWDRHAGFVSDIAHLLRCEIGFAEPAIHQGSDGLDRLGGLIAVVLRKEVAHRVSIDQKFRGAADLVTLIGHADAIVLRPARAGATVYVRAKNGERRWAD